MRCEIDFQKAFRGNAVNPEWKCHVTTDEGWPLTEAEVNEKMCEHNEDKESTC